ncbi:helix-turn-helix domain-containing protein [Lacrimispora amygdalina]|uniref:helix-turn-helix domain-containing protein n=1 Tax=Lacrimispora amygdalina TaxID=253257 RepID=UPI001144E504
MFLVMLNAFFVFLDIFIIQSDVARKIGVKGNILSNYENGISEPDIDTFCALCDIYDLDPARR